MTCIVGYVHENKVYLGGDSAGVSGLETTVRKDPKVFENKKFVMGFTSSFRMGDILKYRFTPPPIKKDMLLEKYMATDFVDSIRECFQKYAYGKIESGEQTGGTFLVGIKGRLFSVDSDFQVGENYLPFNACGCGQPYAYGSMYNDYLRRDLDDPNSIIEKALKAAAEFSGGVLPPFIKVNT